MGRISATSRRELDLLEVAQAERDPPNGGSAILQGRVFRINRLLCRINLLLEPLEQLLRRQRQPVFLGVELEARRCELVANALLHQDVGGRGKHLDHQLVDVAEELLAPSAVCHGALPAAIDGLQQEAVRRVHSARKLRNPRS